MGENVVSMAEWRRSAFRRDMERDMARLEKGLARLQALGRDALASRSGDAHQMRDILETMEARRKA